MINSILYSNKVSNRIQNIKFKKEKNNIKNNIFSKQLKIDTNVKSSNKIKQKKKLYNTCIDMESLMWKQVLNSMKKTINKYNLVDGGQAEKIFTDFLYDEYSTMMAKNTNTKIAETIYNQLSKAI
jgi:Rod binding domain-containing protein